jgi:N-acyl-L-homoserine lactone synthetase
MKLFKRDELEQMAWEVVKDDRRLEEDSYDRSLAHYYWVKGFEAGRDLIIKELDQIIKLQG